MTCLQQADHVVAVGMQKVGQQAVCTATDLAANALDANAVVDFRRARPPLVGAPADQATGWPDSRDEDSGRGEESFDLERERLRCIALTEPEKCCTMTTLWGHLPLVVGLPAREPRREVSSFLPQMGPLSTPLPLPSSLAALAVPFLRRSGYSISVAICILLST